MMLTRVCGWHGERKPVLGVEFPPEFEGRTVYSHGICALHAAGFRAERVAGSTRIPPDLATELLKEVDRE